MENRYPIFQLDDINRTIHEPARLLILSMLNAIDSADFVFLHNQSGLTRGNFSTHISRLEEEQYIAVKKEFVDRKPTTVYTITKAGRSALENYCRKLYAILDELDCLKTKAR